MEAVPTISVEVTADELWTRQFKTHWGLDASLRRLDGEFDLNFMVESEPGAILKVMRPNCAPGLVDMQIDCLEHLAATATVPRVLPATDGRRYVELVDAAGDKRLAWLISRLPGVLYADMRPRTLDLVHGIGNTLARMDAELAGFDHPALDRSLKWDLRAALWVREYLHLERDAKYRGLMEKILDTFETRCLPVLNQLPVQAIHNDINDWNVLCETSATGAQRVAGFIDFGDMIRAPVVCNLAIAGAYVMLDQPRPVEALARLTQGYHAARALTAEEVELVWPLALTRMVVSSLNAALMQQDNPDDPYITVSLAPVNRFFERLPAIMEAFVFARLRRAVGLESVATGGLVAAWVQKNRARFAPIVDTDLSAAPILDLSVGGRDAPPQPLAPDMGAFESAVNSLITPGGAALGRYAEPRLIYGGPAFQVGDHPVSDRRTVHLGVDAFLSSNAPVRAPWDGVVNSVEFCADAYDYGGLVTLKHVTSEGIVFYTLYGHLAHDVSDSLFAGQQITVGDAFAKLGTPDENGGWPPHLHFQLGLVDAPGSVWPGVADPDELQDWMVLYPDPAALLGLAPGQVTSSAGSEAHAGQLSDVYAWKSLLFDTWGRAWLNANGHTPGKQLVDNSKVKPEHDIGDVHRGLLEGLQAIARATPALGDICKKGLCIEIEVVEAGGMPAAEKARYASDRLRERRILVGRDESAGNVLKILPGEFFSNEDARYFLSVVAETFAETPLTL